jgi:hypothetical protein
MKKLLLKSDVYEPPCIIQVGDSDGSIGYSVESSPSKGETGV